MVPPVKMNILKVDSAKQKSAVKRRDFTELESPVKEMKFARSVVCISTYKGLLAKRRARSLGFPEYFPG